jgi:hypothetical protein
MLGRDSKIRRVAARRSLTAVAAGEAIPAAVRLRRFASAALAALCLASACVSGAAAQGSGAANPMLADPDFLIHAIERGISPADQTAMNDFGQHRVEQLIGQAERSGLVSQDELRQLGDNPQSYTDGLNNLIFANPEKLSGHPELKTLIDGYFQLCEEALDRRDGMANADRVALAKARQTLAVQKAYIDAMFVDGSAQGGGQPVQNEGGHDTEPGLAPNAPSAPARPNAPPPIAQTTPETPNAPPGEAAPPVTPTPPPLRPPRTPTISADQDPALHVNGDRTPTPPAPAPAAPDPAIHVPPAAQNPTAPPPRPTISQDQLNNGLNTRTNIPVAPVVAPPPTTPETVNGPNDTGGQGNATFSAQSPTDMGLPNGQQRPSTTSSAAAAAAAAAAAGSGTNSQGGTGDQQDGGGGDGPDQGDHNGGTPIVLPPSMTRPGRVGNADGNPDEAAAIVAGVDPGTNQGASAPSSSSGSRVGSSGAASQGGSGPYSGGGPATVATVAPIYNGYNVSAHPGAAMQSPDLHAPAPTAVLTHPSTQINVPSTQVQVPTSVMTVPSTQVNVPSTQVQVPSAVMTVPSTQVNIPSPVMTVPSTQIEIPSPELCGR